MSRALAQQLLKVTPDKALVLEHELSLDRGFSQLDAITRTFLTASLAGEKVVSLRRGKVNQGLTLHSLSKADLEYLRFSFLQSGQQSRGAWFLPDEVTVRAGIANLPYHFGQYPRFACGVAGEETCKVPLAGLPEALYFWTVLEPLFDLVYRPIWFRSTDPPKGDRKEQLESWADVESKYQDLGFEVNVALNPIRPGGGWSRLGSHQRVMARQELLDALRSTATLDVGARYRLLGVKQLLEKYHAKAKRSRPTMRQVLTKPLQRILSAFFEGDWLAFLGYIGEEPPPEERIATSLAEPKLFVTAGERVASVASKHGIPASEIERMLQAFWAGEGAESPVSRRIGVLREFWKHFEDVHARQAPGMPSLWGFIEEDSDTALRNVYGDASSPPWHAARSYVNFLPSTLFTEIQSLWEGTFLARWPERIVSTPVPYALMTEALGSAVSFWHGIGLTAWFLSEGPYSRTKIEDLETYYSRPLSDLAGCGCPVDHQLFVELIAAEKKLGEPRPYRGPGADSLAGRSTMNVEFGSSRAGFELLRDIVTEHRREWTRMYLEPYLRCRWEMQIRTSALEYSRLWEQKGKAPTVKQFAKFAEAPTNHWFSGDVSLLYGAFGERSPVQTVRVRVLPRDVRGFVLHVYSALGGSPIEASKESLTGSNIATSNQNAAMWEETSRKRLAELGVWYVHLCEALGGSPTLKEFGRSRFENLALPIMSDVDEGWSLYSSAIDKVLESMKES